MIHLLQRPPLRLLDSPHRPHQAQKTPHREEDIRPIIRILHQRRRDEPNDEIHQPVRRRAQRHALAPQAAREDLGGVRPGHGAPRRAEREHVEKQKPGADPALGLVRGPVGRVGAHEAGDDGVRDEHARGTPEEEGFAAQPVHGEEGGGDADELRDVEDAGEDELEVVVEAHGGEEGGGVVDECVDSVFSSVWRVFGSARGSVRGLTRQTAGRRRHQRPPVSGANNSCRRGRPTRRARAGRTARRP